MTSTAVFDRELAALTQHIYSESRVFYPPCSSKPMGDKERFYEATKALRGCTIDQIIPMFYPYVDGITILMHDEAGNKKGVRIFHEPTLEDAESNTADHGVEVYILS